MNLTAPANKITNVDLWPMPNQPSGSGSRLIGSITNIENIWSYPAVPGQLVTETRIKFAQRLSRIFLVFGGKILAITANLSTAHFE